MTGPQGPKRDAWTHVYAGTQLALAVLIGVWAGVKADARFGSSPWGTLAGAFLGIVVGLYQFLMPFLRRGR